MKIRINKIAFWVLSPLIFGISIAGAQTFQWPVDSPAVTQPYACYDCFVTDKYHTGLDIDSLTNNTTIYAADSGTITVIDKDNYEKENHGLGNVVIIDQDNGVFGLYAHLASILVTDGQYITKGTQIGVMGDTGNVSGVHLHFEVKAWPVLGNLDDDEGPFWGYTPGDPNWHGFINPYPYLEYNINSISPTPIGISVDNSPIRTGPDPSYTQYFGTVSSGQKFVAFSEYNGWYQVFLPSNDGPATGWVQGTVESSANLLEVDDPVRGTIGVSVRDNPTTTGNRISYVWDDQQLVGANEASAGNGCNNPWYEIYLPDGFSSLTGWVCSDYLTVIGMTDQPDLVVINPSVSDATLTPGQSLTINATAKNQGTDSSSSTTLRYYLSTDATITTGDTQLGVDFVSALSPNGTSPESLSTTAPSTDGTYWVGACVDAVSGESVTTNQCSTGVPITVATPPDTIPDAFSFTAQTGLALNTEVTSNTITISGINAPASITVAGGQYSVNGGAYTSVAGTVTNGQTVTVKQTSSSSSSTTTTATLTIGGVSEPFNVTTQGQDTSTFQWPVDAPRITQDYACKDCFVDDKFHTGMDITSAFSNTTILAVRKGKVFRTFKDCQPGDPPYSDDGLSLCGGGWGNHVVIDHQNGLYTVYAHLKEGEVSVAAPNDANQGTEIGMMGETGAVEGAHLHFEVLVLKDPPPNPGNFTPSDWEGKFGLGSGYTSGYPETDSSSPGHLDLKDFVQSIPIRVNITTLVCERPISCGDPNPTEITTVSQNQEFVAIAKSTNNWYYISLPSTVGPSAKTYDPQATYGWVSGDFVIPNPLSTPTQVKVDGKKLADANKVSLKVWPSPGTSNSELTKIWGGQRFITFGSPQSGTGCSDDWYEIYLAANSGATSGWVCGDSLTVISNPPTLQFHLQLQGITIAAQKSATLSFFTPGTSNKIAEFTETSDGTGHFALPSDVSLAAGMYDILVVSPRYLSKRMNGVTLYLNSTVTLSELLAGDLNDDGIINSIDWSIMSPKWGTDDPIADINQDGLVNSIDFSFMNTNWFKTSDQ